MDADGDIGPHVLINKRHVERLLATIQNKGVCRVKQTVLSTSNPGETTRDRLGSVEGGAPQRGTMSFSSTTLDMAA